MMLQMKGHNVTSIICLCNVLAVGLRAPHGTNEAYFPEWLLSTYAYGGDANFHVRNEGPGPAHLSHTFGITFQPRQVVPEQTPANWALQEAAPSSADTQDGLSIYNRNAQYRSLLLIASGIQLAGPVLTPGSFERGLQAAHFPNPGHPIMAGTVGFEGGSHAMTRDAAEFWWDVDDAGPYADDAPGTLCYVDAGKRRSAGSWARQGDPYFAPSCDSGR
jgi:hypothetical protein